MAHPLLLSLPLLSIGIAISYSNSYRTIEGVLQHVTEFEGCGGGLNNTSLLNLPRPAVNLSIKGLCRIRGIIIIINSGVLIYSPISFLLQWYTAGLSMCSLCMAVKWNLVSRRSVTVAPTNLSRYNCAVYCYDSLMLLQ